MVAVIRLSCKYPKLVLTKNNKINTIVIKIEIIKDRRISIQRLIMKLMERMVANYGAGDNLQYWIFSNFFPSH